MRAYLIRDLSTGDQLGIVRLDYWGKNPRSTAKAAFAKQHDMNPLALSALLLKEW